MFQLLVCTDADSFTVEFDALQHVRSYVERNALAAAHYICVDPGGRVLSADEIASLHYSCIPRVEVFA